MSDPMQALYERTLRQIAEAEAAYQDDMRRIDDETRQLKDERWQRLSIETRPLHDLRRKLADQLSDRETFKPIEVTI